MVSAYLSYPEARASLHNMDGSNLTPQNLSLAVVESATYGAALRY